mmetsp:Transcript_12851/g.39919  ORF Transcript_12851/g.39919 Transcript_12851/m.39919 type:complete len:104 (-) Transcript_12851:30-341(-)
MALLDKDSLEMLRGLSSVPGQLASLSADVGSLTAAIQKAEQMSSAMGAMQVSVQNALDRLDKLERPAASDHWRGVFLFGAKQDISLPLYSSCLSESVSTRPAE